MPHDNTNRIGGVIVRLLVLNALHRGFYIWSGQAKDYKTGICCFSVKHAALWRKRRLVGSKSGHRGRDRMVVGYTTTGAYHH
jgi:hypothetical protein